MTWREYIECLSCGDPVKNGARYCGQCKSVAREEHDIEQYRDAVYEGDEDE